VKIVALLSWHDEQPEHLQACVRSLRFCDALVAVGGPYADWPDPRPPSLDEADAIADAAAAAGLDLLLHLPRQPWRGNEVAKRSFVFQLARQLVKPMHDWYLVMDADDQVAKAEPDELRARLDASGHDVGWLTLRTSWRTPWDDRHGTVEHGFRKLFRALPEITVIGTHWYFVGRRDTGEQVILWGDERIHQVAECVDVRDLLTVEHRKNLRDPDRDNQRNVYYQAKDQLERIPVHLEHQGGSA
jgi:hypothetical protein